MKETLQKVAATLKSLQAPYALIGGFALMARGIVRATKDVDFLIDFPLHEAASLTQSLRANGLDAVFRKGGAEDPIVGIIRVTLPTSTDPIQCDILFPSRAWQAEAVRNANPVKLEGFDVPVVRADDLFLLKLYAGGPQDLMDAANLYELQSGEERRAWKERAAKIGRSKMFARCLTFLPIRD
ncbi:MAG TPA: nucleotidyl transferase AbiEii/AbiGii toxin family protein [Terriglobia bacterium]|nr:nucleotidyl transferase AbiEii/AbiGii toxin family protein [Terriglobia bacterium]